VFPESDKSSDVIRALEKALWERNVDVRLHEKVREVRTFDGSVRSVKTDKRKIEANAVILATGGLSYPTTGSDGSGFALAEKLGHSLVQPVPSLVGLNTKETFVRELAGLTLKNVAVRVYDAKEKEQFTDFGELLFTHTGVSGPVILSASSVLSRRLAAGDVFILGVDLKPALSEKQLHERILREITETPNQHLKSLTPRLLPKSLGEVLLQRAGLLMERPLHSLTKEERGNFVNALKDFRLTIIGPGDFKEAIITCGGIPVKEVNPKTMESKKVEGLYFAGEMLDCDAMTGGYNLQIAWSTGALAGRSAALG
jgi:predicted Rossmann fold flavoprotein